MTITLRDLALIMAAVVVLDIAIAVGQGVVGGVRQVITEHCRP